MSNRRVCDEQRMRKGGWTREEDMLLVEYVSHHGEGRWSDASKFVGLKRNGKSCRLRWVNYLRPGLKKGRLTPLEKGIIIELHALWGNKWSTIARYLPGRTDNEIKNYWRTHFKNIIIRPNTRSDGYGRKKIDKATIDEEMTASWRDLIPLDDGDYSWNMDYHDHNIGCQETATRSY